MPHPLEPPTAGELARRAAIAAATRARWAAYTPAEREAFLGRVRAGIVRSWEGRRRPAAEPPPPYPPGSGLAPLAGTSADFAIDPAGEVWCCRKRGGHRCPWRKLRTVMRGRDGRTPCYRLRTADGRPVYLAAGRLRRDAIERPPLPNGPIPPDWKDDLDDDADPRGPEKGGDR